MCFNLILLPTGILSIYIHSSTIKHLTALPSGATHPERERDRGWEIYRGISLDEKRNFKHLFSFQFTGAIGETEKKALQLGRESVHSV